MHNVHRHVKSGHGSRMSTIEDLFTKSVLVFGCGNILMGDDGFGPAVIEHLLANFDLPPQVAAFDAGTAIRDLLFDLALMPRKPETILIVDAVFESEKRPGEIFEIDVCLVPANKASDFSLHMFPSVNLLDVLRERRGVNIRVLVVQAENMPEEIGQGLSDSVSAAVPGACRWLLHRIGELS